MSHIPVTDTIAHALMQLVDDSNNNGVYREPSHADIEFHVNQAGLAEHDPKQQGQMIGKAKRVRAVLYAVMDSNPVAASRFTSGLLAKVRRAVHEQRQAVLTFPCRRFARKLTRHS